MMSNESSPNFRSDLGEGEYKEKYHRLREQHEIDKRVLLAQFHYQTNTLQQQHQHQLQEHLKMFLAHQKEQQQKNQPTTSEETTFLHTVKPKEKQSAIASNAVKKHLQKFVIDRQKVKGIDSFSNIMHDRSHAHRWSPSFDGNVDHGKTPAVAGITMNKFDDFPLRKTASEPNLKVKSRLKQKLSSDQRCSPLPIRRSEIKTDLANRIKQKLSLEKGENTLDVGSPCDFLQHSQKGSSYLVVESTELHEDNVCDLYSSPSLPNISLALSQKQPDALIFSHPSDDLNCFIGRTLSHPSSAGHVSPKLDHWFFQQGGDNGIPSRTSLPPGPIRPHQLARRHKTLSRTRSAPTASSQLQQHILQRKQQRMLQQQQENLRKIQSLAKTDNSKFSHCTEDKQRINQGSHMKLNTTDASPLNLLSTLPSSDLIESNNQPTISLELHQLESKLSHSGKPISRSITHRPLMRTQSSPASSFLKKLNVKKDYRFTTGIAYSPVMLEHGCACGDDHIENSARVEAIWKRLHACGHLSDSGNFNGTCEFIEARKATTDELQLVHTQEHTLRYGTTSLARKELDLSSKFIVLPCGGVGVDNGIDIDTVWNELATINAARMAVGCTVDLALLVAENKLKNGFAVVRPPGHHAQKNLAMAFCYFNSVAVAARKLQSKFSKDCKKILIIDWDVHHCNGTQNIFYADPTVLVISVHRYDDGQFFPGTGSLAEVGTEEGIGYNVNIGFSNSMDPPMGDADYIAVFRTIVLPIAHQFNPDFVFVSSGFSPAAGHPTTLGGYKVTPQCFGYLTNQVMQLANGKVVMALEGGFELNVLCDCTEACVNSLLGNKSTSSLTQSMMSKKPCFSTVKCMEAVISIQAPHWKCLENTNIHQSYFRWQLESKEDEACNAMASLSVQNHIEVKDETSAHEIDTSPSSPSLEMLEISRNDKNNFSISEDFQGSDLMTVDISNTVHINENASTENTFKKSRPTKFVDK